jgi:enoyl-CoA hydratase/carnithine racemase
LEKLLSTDVSVELRDDFIAIVEFSRPPNNYFDPQLVRGIADAYEQLDGERSCRVIVLCSAGKHFCAGADFAAAIAAGDDLYEQAIRLFAAQTPVVAAVQGSAIGGGVGLALSADFRVASPESRFCANFTRLGIHHGFGMTVTLPLVVGHQRAIEMLYTGVRLEGEQAFTIGLCDRLAPAEGLREEALALAAEIAASAPLAVRATRITMRGDLAQRLRYATVREADEQAKLFATKDFPEGIMAATERREPRFRGS